MAWKKVEGTRVHNFDEEPLVEGMLTTKVESEYGGYDYILELANGDKVKVFGKTSLNSRMENVRIGQKVRISFLGLKHSDKTGRTYHNYEVEVQA